MLTIVYGLGPVTPIHEILICVFQPLLVLRLRALMMSGFMNLHSGLSGAEFRQDHRRTILLPHRRLLILNVLRG